MAENCFVGIFIAIDRNVSSRQATLRIDIKADKNWFNILFFLETLLDPLAFYSIQKMTEFDETFRSFTF